MSRHLKSARRRRPEGRKDAIANKLKLPPKTEAVIRDLSHDGRGVAKVDGRTVFVEGALGGETVELRYRRRRGKFDEAEVTRVLEASPDRVEPPCPHFVRCGGCQLQHLSMEGQLRHKQQLLLRTLERIGKVQPDQVLEPISSTPWNYRRRARLAVRCLDKSGNKVELGFREADSERVVPLSQCRILISPFDHLFDELAELLGGLQARRRIPQVELLVADSGNAINIHLLSKLQDADRQQLLAFASSHKLAIYWQSEGADTVRPLTPDTSPLTYRLPNYNVALEFLPGSFLQVNSQVNHQLVDCVVQLLDLKGDETVLDLFCGLGNFTLPLARRTLRVVGVEGSARAIEMAKTNADKNAIGNAEFYVADLTESHRRSGWAAQKYDAIVLDPPRSGAAGVMPLVGNSGAGKIVYVSCHPGSLARDVGELVSQYGYRLVSAGAVEMFPHTAHLESVVLLEK